MDYSISKNGARPGDPPYDCVAGQVWTALPDPWTYDPGDYTVQEFALAYLRMDGGRDNLLGQDSCHHGDSPKAERML